MQPSRIAELHAREILDSRGNPTIEVDCILANGVMGRASVPSGASTGESEAKELRDMDESRYLGKGVLKAVANVNDMIRPRLIGMDVTDQYRIDQALLELDSTEGKSELGANAILGASLAACRAAAASTGLPVYRLLKGTGRHLLPTPQFNIINGGAHARTSLAFQEYMVVPAGFDSLSHALRAATETYHHLKKLLSEAGKRVGIGDEGGFAPDFEDNEEPIKFILKAIEKAGYRPGEQMFLALDVAASQFFEDETYLLDASSGSRVKAGELIDLYARWLDNYPVISIEDGLAEHDREGWRELTARLSNRVQLVGDDIFVTSTEKVKQALADNIANAVLIKPNQVGTVTETLECVEFAQTHQYATVVSHRSGETTDDFIADLAVAVNSGQIKTGAPCRGERVAKYNRLLRIEEQDRLEYAGLKPFER